MFLPEQWYYGLAALIVAGIASVASGRIDKKGAATGVLVGFCIFLGGGFLHLGLLLVFFVAGSAASRWKLGKKQQLSLAESRHAKRSVANVVANGGIAACCGLMAWLYPDHNTIWLLALACSLSAACADTLSSEIGNIHGRHFINILTLQPDTRGKDGVVSLEGSLWGVAGAFLIATTALPAHPYFLQWLIIIISGITGNLADSILGAGLQRRGYMNNHAVNLANTMVGAVTGAILYRVLL